ncbi:MAG: TIGR04282 family arsenosugar biosynthesis glycosyltransferase [Verrucomicrobia bacterium]|nr:TIGR04282 family arsenosugar biosynthesis glycosyltransferase [Verrucomicrobiota bacterium]
MSELAPGPEQLIIFVKAPRPGAVKTRLAETLGAVAACEAYCRLVESLLSRLASLREVELRFTPDDAGAEIKRWLGPGWTARPQGTGDLGTRLEAAFVEAFARGAERVVIIGSDCPRVTVEDVQAAWRALEEHDVVLGPATDGGYWLIGLRSRQRELFDGIAWSTSRVLAQTLARAQAAGLRVQRLRELSDVDTAEDWRGFLASSSPGQFTGSPKRT